MAENYIVITYDPSNVTEASQLFQYDQGQALKLEGFDNFARPFEFHISNSKYGRAEVFECDGDIVEIPDKFLRTGREICVWLYLSRIEVVTDDLGNEVTKNIGKTVYTVEIPVRRRAAISTTKPTPEEESMLSKILHAVTDIGEKVDDIGQFFDNGTVIFEGMNATERNDWENG